jgi:hypothetical protein
VLRPLAAIVLVHFSGNFTRALIHAIKKFKRVTILFSLPDIVICEKHFFEKNFSMGWSCDLS